MVSTSNCGGFSSGDDACETANTIDCIEFDYDGASTLALRHVNAGLNCCPGIIDVEVSVRGNVIILDERDIPGSCHCLCLFDIDLEIQNLPPGVYLMRVLEPLVGTGATPLEFEVNLSGPSTGCRCVHRDTYPWGTWQ